MGPVTPWTPPGSPHGPKGGGEERRREGEREDVREKGRMRKEWGERYGGGREKDRNKGGRWQASKNLVL